MTRALHGLRTEPPGDGPVPGAGDLVSAVDAALLQISGALESDRAIGDLPPLRTLYHRVEDACAGQPERAGVVIQLDELVNAVDTAADLLAGPADGTSG